MVQSDFLASDSDFGGFMKNVRNFLGCEKKEGFFGVAKKGLRDFLGRQILKLGFFGYKI